MGSRLVYFLSTSHFLLHSVASTRLVGGHRQLGTAINSAFLSLEQNSRIHRSAAQKVLNSFPASSFVQYTPQTFTRQYRHQSIFKMATDSGTNESIGLTEAGKSNPKRNTNDADEAITDWKSRIDISIAKSRKIRGSNYVQISTIDHTTMEPRCRTVVFRGFMKNMPSECVGYGDVVMKMITDARSSKVSELKSFHDRKLDGNNVEMVWW